MASTPSRCSEPSTTCSMTVGAARDPPARLPFDWVDVPPELGGDHDLIPIGGERLADEFLVGVRTVDLGGVEERDAAIDRGADQRDHLLPVGLVAVAAGHAHAAQSDGGDLEAVAAEGALVHGSFFSLWKVGCGQVIVDPERKATRSGESPIAQSPNTANSVQPTQGAIQPSPSREMPRPVARAHRQIRAECGRSRTLGRAAA